MDSAIKVMVSGRKSESHSQNGNGNHHFWRKSLPFMFPFSALFPKGGRGSEPTKMQKTDR